MKPKVLVISTVTIPAAGMAELNQLFDIHYAPTEDTQAQLLKSDWVDDATAVFCSGSIGVPQDILDRMPKLAIICVGGTGYDKLDVPALRARGVRITHGAGVNAPSVADHAFALILGALRHLPQLDGSVRAGQWGKLRGDHPLAYRKRLGIIGYGSIGSAIAKRAAGFDMPVAYHNRNRRADVPHPYCATPLELATRSDILVISTPGGPGTLNMVGKEVLEALGPKGYLINVARGSVVDTDALVEALKTKRIAGAGLDVWEGEPTVPQALLDHPDVVLTPHVGGRSPEAADILIEQVIGNLKAHFAGQPLLTPIPT